MGTWSTLLDVANLAVNVSQSASLANQREQLETLRNQAAYAAVVEQILNELKHVVYVANGQAKALTEFKEEAPQAVYVVATTILQRFSSIGIKPEIFPQFQDKEYVGAVIRELDAVVTDTRTRLDANQLAEAQQCIAAIAQMPMLENAIEVQSIHEKLTALQQDWVSAKAEHDGWHKKANLVFLGMVLAAGASLPLGFLVMLGDFQSGVGICSFAPFLILFGLVAWFVIRSKGNTSRYEQLKKQEESLKAKLEELPSINDIQQAVGAYSSEGYKQIRSNNQVFIQKVLAPAAKLKLPAEIVQSMPADTLASSPTQAPRPGSLPG